MRVVHVVRSHGWSGVEQHCATLAQGLVSLGHEVSMVGGDPAVARTVLRASGVDHVAARTLTDVVVALSRRRRPDLLHAHMSAAEVAGALTPRLLGVPMVGTRHFASTRGSRVLTRPLVRLAARRLVAEIAISDFVAQRTEGPSRVIHPGIPSAPVSRHEDRHRVVLVVQRLQPEKHTAVAVAAFAASGLAAEGWRLEVLGDGAQRAELEAQAADLGIGTATAFLGRRSDVLARMGRARILLAPTPGEGLGLAVLEAMSTGLPVVASASGGHLETVGRVEGAALFEPGDAPGAGERLAVLGHDEKRLAAYGEALRHAQRTHFSVERQARETEDLYRSLL